MVMVKLPCRPITRIVALVALRHEHAFVHIAHLVTLFTLVELRAKLLRGMTRIARKQLVHACNREVGKIVIEARGGPA